MPIVDLSAPASWPIERLAGVGRLPRIRFEVACFPLRIVGARAAPARVVAFVPD